MKQALIATLAGVTMAVDTATLAKLMQQAPFSFQNSNDPQDSDIKRELPNFANPARQNDVRPPLEEEERTGDELIPKAVRNKQAAIKDPVLALQPQVKPLFPGSRDMEPIDPKNKKFKSPVFLVDPKFTKEMKDDDKMLFEDNDHGGFKQPVVQSTWPIIRTEVQKFFHVGPGCTCEDKNRPVFYIEPRYERLHLPEYYDPVWEPQYENPSYVMPKQAQKTQYQGDDYGGHNIPFPHPIPPKPASIYDDTAFVDLYDTLYGVKNTVYQAISKPRDVFNNFQAERAAQAPAAPAALAPKAAPKAVSVSKAVSVPKAPGFDILGKPPGADFNFGKGFGGVGPENIAGFTQQGLGSLSKSFPSGHSLNQLQGHGFAGAQLGGNYW